MDSKLARASRQYSFGGLDLGDDRRPGFCSACFALGTGLARLTRERLLQLLLFLFLLLCEVALSLCELIVWFGQFDPR